MDGKMEGCLMTRVLVFWLTYFSSERLLASDWLIDLRLFCGAEII